MNDSVELVKKLGLNEYESKAYISLLGVESATASQVSKISLIPRARVYDVLTTLEKRGFIEKKLSKPIAYSALSPGQVAKNIGSHKKNLFEQEVQEILSIGQMLEQKNQKAPETGTFADEIKILKGQENIYSKIEKELENCAGPVIFSTSPAGVQRKKAHFKRHIEALAKRGIKINFRPQQQSSATDNGLRYCVIDKKTLFLFLNSDAGKKEEDSALMVKNQFLAAQFSKK